MDILKGGNISAQRNMYQISNRPVLLNTIRCMPNKASTSTFKALSNAKHADLSRQQIDKHVTDIFALTQQLDIDLDLKQRIRSAIEDFRRAWGHIDRTLSMGAIDSQISKLPTYIDSFAAYQRAQQEIRILYNSITEPPLLNTGYSAKDLRTEACIGHGLWQKIIKTSSLRPTSPGECHRKFSDRDVRLLISAAGKLDTAKSRHAAHCWSELIDSDDT